MTGFQMLKCKILSAFPRLLKIPADATNKEIGDIGEQVAVMYLRRRLYRILKRNYKPYNNEIDIIAKKGGKISFVEVKTRSAAPDSPYFRSAYRSVTYRQRKNIVCASKVYKKSHYAKSYSYSIIEVILKKTEKYLKISDICFIPSAFRA